MPLLDPCIGSPFRLAPGTSEGLKVYAYPDDTVHALDIDLTAMLKPIVAASPCSIRFIAPTASFPPPSLT